MNAHTQRKHGRGLLLILALLAFVYVFGALYMLLGWFGIQSYDALLWQRNALPVYALIFLAGAAGLYGTWKWKKWGVYTLAGAWALTGVTNLVFAPPAPTPYKYTFLAVLLLIAFFLLLLPAWRDME